MSTKALFQDGLVYLLTSAAAVEDDYGIGKE